MIKTSKGFHMEYIKHLSTYALFALLSCTMPYLGIVVCIICTGDRLEGMRMGMIPGLISVHLLFGMVSLRAKLWLKAVQTLGLTCIILGIAWLGAKCHLVNTNWDMYGFWNLCATNFLAGLLVWEVFYWINKWSNKARANVY